MVSAVTDRGHTGWKMSVATLTFYLSPLATHSCLFPPLLIPLSTIRLFSIKIGIQKHLNLCYFLLAIAAFHFPTSKLLSAASDGGVYWLHEPHLYCSFRIIAHHNCIHKRRKSVLPSVLARRKEKEGEGKRKTLVTRSSGKVRKIAMIAMSSQRRRITQRVGKKF